MAIWLGLVSLVAAAIVLSWPYRRERHFVLRQVIAAPRETIWNAYHPGAEDPAHAAFHEGLVSCERVAAEPEIWEEVIDTSGGHGTHFTRVHAETLASDQSAYSVICARAVDEQPYPYGEAHRETLELQDHPAGTLVTLGFRGETATLWQHLHLWFANRGYLRRLRRFCETGGSANPETKSRSFWISIALSVLAVGSFALVFDWVTALLLALVLVVHEFGHWLAMRMTGQPAPRMLLIPFLGGVAVANHPHRSQFDDAFCSLMGAGFSALLVLVLLLVAWSQGMPDLGHFMQELTAYDGSAFPLGTTVAYLCLPFAAAFGLINLLQLVPVLPLDGGQILRALIQSFSTRGARWVLLVLTGLGVAGLGYTQDYILAGILVLGALQAWSLGDRTSKARPMTTAGAAVICLGYGLTVAIHVCGVIYGLDAIDFNGI